MPLRSRTFRLESLAERSQLQLRVWPYWGYFGRGRAVGYLPAREGNGTWQARYAWRDYDTKRTRYRQLHLGYADDRSESDGIRVLSFQQAVSAAKHWIATNADKVVREDFKASPDRLIYLPVGDVYTVAHAVLDYLRYAMMYRKAPEVPMYRANRYILPHIGLIAADELTSEQIREWMEMVAEYPAQRGTGRRLENPTPEQRQRRRNTANAVLSTLTAALNLAFRDGKISTDAAWRRVQKYRAIHRSRVRYLLEDEARRLVEVSPPEFRSLVLGALYTGCRGGELAAMTAGSLDVHTDRLYVAPAKSNWARWLALPDEGVELFRELSDGRDPNDPMFVREGGARWKPSAIQALMVQARRKARLDDGVTFHTLRHTYASYLVMAGASLLAVMKLLGHADIRLVVQCYAHLSPDFLADTLRVNFPRFKVGNSRVSREWREVSNALGGSRPSPAPEAEELLNPAAAAAARWSSRVRGTSPALPLTYAQLAGKV